MASDTKRKEQLSALSPSLWVLVALFLVAILCTVDKFVTDVVPGMNDDEPFGQGPEMPPRAETIRGVSLLDEAQAARIAELQTKVAILESATGQTSILVSDFSEARSSLEARVAAIEIRLSKLEGRVDAAAPAGHAKNVYGSMPEPVKGV
mmetsp:Transcript_32460/g.100037  ORF Transcript_32460/g.100037 Transcript_32460/m.100037 type:complete len:150 (-) Transcript_32460:52-501(-)